MREVFFMNIVVQNSQNIFFLFFYAFQIGIKILLMINKLNLSLLIIRLVWITNALINNFFYNNLSLNK